MAQISQPAAGKFPIFTHDLVYGEKAWMDETGWGSLLVPPMAVSLLPITTGTDRL